MDERSRSLLRERCLIPGCPRPPGLSYHPQRRKWLCEEHWRQLPLSVRRQWWDETAFAKQPPSVALLDTVIQTLTREKT
jgi:hypothetical protein